MVKFCTVCGKEFEGKGDTCTECTKSNNISNEQNSPANTNFLLTKSLNTKWIVRLIILVFLVFLCIIITSSVRKNSQKSYNQYAKELYDTVISNNLELKQESVIIDSNGETHTGKNTQIGSSTILSTNSGEYAPSSYATVIKDKYPKAKKISWILEYDTSGNLSCVLCAKNYNSKKVGVYGEALDANVTSLDSFLAYHSEEAANADAQLDAAYSKAKDIEEYMNATDYYPDGIDQYAVITNINNKADSELCNTITSKFGGYWIIRGIVSSKNSGLYSEYTVYWASDLETELVGDSTYNFSKKTSGGIQSQLTAYEDTGCSLISKEEWMKKYEAEYLQKQNAAQEKKTTTSQSDSDIPDSVTNYIQELNDFLESNAAEKHFPPAADPIEFTYLIKQEGQDSIAYGYKGFSALLNLKIYVSKSTGEIDAIYASSGMKIYKDELEDEWWDMMCIPFVPYAKSNSLQDVREIWENSHQAYEAQGEMGYDKVTYMIAPEFIGQTSDWIGRIDSGLNGTSIKVFP